ncbi:MAG TPA: YggS family pyridoxal phosphate-dependent enzyme [Chitinophagaceae bacterium]|nr:YggS family pyridoxal phosphate-dependent enzyme [Chitinophagaceae bacterium]
MPVDINNYNAIYKQLNESKVTLVAVSKTKPVEDLLALYQLGQRDFGENYVQELVQKATVLPADIKWHFIGHLQTNKVKLIIPFVQLIHGVDSLKLLKEIQKQAIKVDRVIDCLLQVYIAKEESKFGLDAAEVFEIIEEAKSYANIRICGLMGMASFTEDAQTIRQEFLELKLIFDGVVKQQKTIAENQLPCFNILSMGMSADYKIAVATGTTMVRIGSLLFGERKK